MAWLAKVFHQPVKAYRQNFKPSAQLERPYAMPCISVFAAETDADAERLFSSLKQQFVNLRRGRPGKLQPPLNDGLALWSEAEIAGVNHALSLAVVGSATTVQAGLERFIAATGADELMITAQIFDHAARLRSYEIVADIRAHLR